MENPTTALRTELGLSVTEMANHLKVNRNTVQYAEAGCYGSIPVVYRRHLPLDAKVYEDYRLFQRKKRERLCWQFPLDIESLSDFMFLNAPSVRAFCISLCVQQSDAFRLLKGERRFLPAQWRLALLEAGASSEFLVVLGGVCAGN